MLEARLEMKRTTHRDEYNESVYMEESECIVDIQDIYVKRMSQDYTDKQVCLLVGSPIASTTQSDSPGPSMTPSYTPGPSTTPSYSLGPSRNAECANCKLLIGKLQVLEATLEMYMHPEKHTIDSTALLHELYNDMGKFSLE
ncbi:hypothetical protein Tco_0480694 [Tanacetum coccineum]